MRLTRMAHPLTLGACLCRLLLNNPPPMLNRIGSLPSLRSKQPAIEIPGRDGAGPVVTLQANDPCSSASPSLSLSSTAQLLSPGQPTSFAMQQNHQQQLLEQRKQDQMLRQAQQAKFEADTPFTMTLKK